MVEITVFKFIFERSETSFHFVLVSHISWNQGNGVVDDAHRLSHAKVCCQILCNPTPKVVVCKKLYLHDFSNLMIL